MTHGKGLAVLFLCLLYLAACGRGDADGTSALGVQPARSQALTVLAAASLTDVFTDLKQTFQTAHPGVEITVAFAGSQVLATQIRAGISADVFASADARHVDALAREGLIERPQRFAENSLVIALASSVHDTVTLATLPTLGSLVVGDENVPVGRYTRTLFDAAQARYGDAWRNQIEAEVVSREPDVRLALSKVSMGEADAAIVYRSDLVQADGVRADGVRAVSLPADLAPTAAYFQARIVGAAAPALAKTWMAYIVSPKGRAALQRWGFQVGTSRP
ncbi:MAG: molybdate ABC transporter substrate-binding protein [Oligoflexia bacterium]|nr:molybdate ABC transporter substrate-binding protein [Oligoflexia bacterium]